MEIHPAVTIGDTELVEGRDYEVVYHYTYNDDPFDIAPSEVGDYMLRVQPVEGSSYVDYHDQWFYIEEDDNPDAIDINSCPITYETEFTYDGTDHAGEGLEIVDGDYTLVQDVDYIIVNADAGFDVGSYSYEVRGIGDYTGESYVDYIVVPRSLDDCDKHFDTTGLDLPYNGAAQYPAIEFVMSVNGSSFLLADDDLTVRGETDMTTVGSQHVVFEGIGNFTGTYDMYYSIVQRDLDDTDVTIAPIPAKAWTGEDVGVDPSDITLRIGEYTLEPDTDYQFGDYANNVDPGTATLTLEGVGNFTGTRDVNFEIVKDTRSIADCEVEEIDDMMATGEQLMPTPAVTYNGVPLAPGSDFEYSYGENIYKGKGSVTITGKRLYEGTKTVQFDIVVPVIPMITSAEDLVAFRESVNLGNDYSRMTVTLASDIDLEDEAWTPVGCEARPFKGTFAGQGHTIEGLNVDGLGEDYQGLFGYVESAKIKDLVVKGTVKGGDNTGGIIGYSRYDTRLTNVGSEVDVTSDGDQGVGGVVGWFYGTEPSMTGCYSKGTVTSTSKDGLPSVGGLVGCVNHVATITSCYSTGAVTSSAKYARTGGLIGYVPTTTSAPATLANCYSSGEVTAVGEESGMLIGRLGGINETQPSYYPASASYAACGNGTLSSAVAKTADELASDDFVATLNAATANTWQSGATIGQASPALMWEFEAVTVTFDTADGSAVASQHMLPGAKATQPDDPTRDGYAFVRWEDASGNAFDFESAIEQDTTVTAAWAKLIPIKIQPYDPATQQNVTDCTIELVRKDTGEVVSPEQDGSYLVAAGQEYTLNITAEGYKDYSEVGSFMESAAGTTWNAALISTTPATATLDLVATNKDTNQPITDVEVAVKVTRASTGEEAARLSTGAFELVIGDTYNIEATAEGYEPYTATVVINSNSTQLMPLTPLAPAPDRSALDALIEEAQDELDDTCISEDGSDVEPEDQWVTKGVAQALADAIGDAESVTSGSQAQYDAAANALQHALDDFVAAKKPGTAGTEPLDLFDDVSDPSKYYFGSVYYMRDLGLMSGVGNNKFGVGNELNRAQLAAIMFNAAGSPAGYRADANTTGMADLNRPASGRWPWYTQCANWAVDKGIVNGIANKDGSKSFKPSGTVTLEMLVGVLSNNWADEVAAADVSVLERYPDGKEVSGWAKKAIAWGVSEGIIGNGATLGCKSSIKRERCAAVLANAVDAGILEVL